MINSNPIEKASKNRANIPDINTMTYRSLVFETTTVFTVASPKYKNNPLIPKYMPKLDLVFADTKSIAIASLFPIKNS